MQWTLLRLSGFPVAQTVKNPPAIQETWVQSLRWEDPLENGIGYPLQYLRLENPMDRGAWRLTVLLTVGHHWATNTFPFCSISAKSLGKPWWGFSTFYGKPLVFSSTRGLNGGKRRLLQGRRECSPSPGAVIYTEGPCPAPWSLWGPAGNSPAMFAWMQLPSRWWIRPRCLCVCFVHFTCW